ncbi:MAG: asparagine synthetase B [Nevskiales bacterium]
MSGGAGRFVITYNGEIYNFQELRTELQQLGHRFRGRNDTEVLLAAVSHWGVPAALDKLNGMFAFALWDRHERQLWLVRDRLGKKPLYFGIVNGALCFASELKAIRCVPGFRGDIDRESLTLFLRHNYVPAPKSIYVGIEKLRPGYFVQFEVQNGQVSRKNTVRYWSIEDVARQGSGDPSRDSPEEAARHLEALLRDAVQKRMISDVPLGAFLSGGIDSSLIVALMQAQSTAPIRTFTVGFREKGFDESVFARRIANHLGTDHTEIFLSAKDALDVVPRLPEIYDEPFADSSQIPTYLVNREARRFVTVAVSGDGGDEGFCGYNRYVWWRRIWSVSEKLPMWSRRALTSIVKGISVPVWDKTARPVLRILPPEFRHGAAGEKIHKLADLLAVDSPDALYTRLVSHWKDPAAVVIGGSEPGIPRDEYRDTGDIDEFTNRMMVLDIQNYLPDDILVKVDRASMAVSLEVRAPLLDYRVIEFAARLPLAHKLHGASGKAILRRILGKFLPDEFFDRAKTGFGVPLEQWLRGPLRDWAESLLTKKQLEMDGYFAVAPVHEMWNDLVLRGKATHYFVWDVLMFQAWLRHLEAAQPTPGLIEDIPRCGT